MKISESTQITQQIRELADLSFSKYADLQDIGVLSGRSGIALFQFYCAKYFDEDQYAENGVDIISSCIDLINNGYSFPTYCGGIAGFGWTLQHLNEKEFVELDLGELLVPFDDYLVAQMDLDLSKGNYDFLHGASGFAFYFLKRYKNSIGNLQNKYKRYIERFIQQLDKLAISKENIIKWESILDHEKGNKGFNLSLSHGISSIIYLLSKIKFEGIEVQLSTKLLNGATSYVLSQEGKAKATISRFPSWVEPNTKLEYVSRIAWCYGDIGIGKALGYASDSLGDRNLLEKSIETLEYASKRLQPDTSFVADAGFCHGSFGNAHIFKELSIKHPHSNFIKAADFWVKDGLNRHTGNKDQPYKQWDNMHNEWRFDLNLLEGISGIGLSLLSYISMEDYSWNECLMLS